MSENGGIGGLTPDEELELDDLLNGPHKACTCPSHTPDESEQKRGR